MSLFSSWICASCNPEDGDVETAQAKSTFEQDEVSPVRQNEEWAGEKNAGILVEAKAVLKPVPEKSAKEKPKNVVFEVEVTIEKELGLVLVESAKHNLICGVSAGVIQDWNSQQVSPNPTVKPGDRILAVDGQRASLAELKTMLASVRGSLTLTIERPRCLSVTFRKNGKPLGLEMSTVREIGLRITDIGEGIISRYNQSAPPGKGIKINDYIHSLRGRESAKDMDHLREIIMEEESVTLLVLSYSEL
eukprot:TRINITY_DN52404_c0_g1_i1.p1 TRINITY_DN52404_c0_g1~~TRINITY_DN52404_c0_g1_i1.p1  ORF type:complete len:248 (-),score=60.77 TRINITY_DN52404_c0_g1_i1:96-839(-)